MAMVTSSASALFSSLSIRICHPISLLSDSCHRPTQSVSLPKPLCLRLLAKNDDIDTTFFDEVNPEEDIPFNPPSRPDHFIAPRPIDEPPFESDEDIARAYEELYGLAYSGESLLGKDVYVMDSKVDERVIQVRRVVKGGKQLRFRAIVVVGDKKGQVPLNLAFLLPCSDNPEHRLFAVIHAGKVVWVS